MRAPRHTHDNQRDLHRVAPRFCVPSYSADTATLLLLIAGRVRLIFLVDRSFVKNGGER